jgi:hypothetical protein
MTHFLGQSVKSQVGDRNVHHLVPHVLRVLLRAGDLTVFLRSGLWTSKRMSSPKKAWKTCWSRDIHQIAASREAEFREFWRLEAFKKRGPPVLATCFWLVLQPRMAVRLGSSRKKFFVATADPCAH